jgi:hypothetical protein
MFNAEKRMTSLFFMWNRRNKVNQLYQIEKLLKQLGLGKSRMLSYILKCNKINRALQLEKLGLIIPDNANNIIQGIGLVNFYVIGISD